MIPDEICRRPVPLGRFDLNAMLNQKVGTTFMYVIGSSQGAFDMKTSLIAGSVLLCSSFAFAAVTPGEGSCISGALKGRVTSFVMQAKSECTGVSEAEGTCVAGALESGVVRSIPQAKMECAGVSQGQAYCIAGALLSGVHRFVQNAKIECR